MKLVLILLALASASPAAAQLSTPDLQIRAKPFSDTHHGVATQDPYRWMEDPGRAAEVTEVVSAWSRASTAQLAKDPRRATFLAMLDAANRAGVRITDLQAAGEVLAYRRLDPADSTSKIVVRVGGVERLLFDPAAGGVNAAVGAWGLSPDGRTVSLHVSPAGSEVGETRFLDVATGREVRERLTPVWGEMDVAWLTPTRIAYTLMDPKSPDPLQNSRAYVADLAGGPGTPVFGAGVSGSPPMPPTEFAIIDHEGVGDWVLAYAANARADQRIFAARRDDLATGKPAWRTVAELADRVGDAVAGGSAVFVLTTKDAPNGRVERLDPTTGARTSVITPPGLVLTSLAAARDGLYVLAQSEGAARLLYVADNSPVREIPLPFEADVASANLAADGASLVLSLMGWTTAPRNFRAVSGRLESLGLDSVGWAEAAKFVVRREEAISPDGAKVPLVIVSKSATGPAPVLLEAYGSYGVPTTTPWYNPYILAWTGAGNTAAYCGTRGGNERGRAWHDAGRERNKVNAHADYIACAERLIQLGLARPGGIAATGTSAGGLLAPIAAQQRPELFGALLPRVAILNPSRLSAAPNGPNQFSEMGDPATADGYRALVAQDAYLALAQAKDIPDTLVVIGLNDRRVAPWMSVKFAAAAREKFGAKRLVLVRADTEAGHGIGSARDVQIREWADTFTFLADRLAANAR